MTHARAIVNGKVLLTSSDAYIYSKGARLILSDGSADELFLRLPVSAIESLFMRSHLLSRLLRLGVHHLAHDGAGGYYCVYNKMCARFSSDGNLIGKPCSLVGSRPLRIDVLKGEMIYGEYRSNPERSPVAIYSYNGREHRKLVEIEGVRHIHSVRVKGEKVYFSTGDYGDEAGLWSWDGARINCIFQGGQQRRAVDFLLSDNHVYYGTDTPLEQNYIYKAAYSGALQQLQAVNGSVFYMSEQAGRYWLATVVEPSDVNTSRHVELWATDLEDKDRWMLIGTYKKDIWPMKLFQYGQIQFPCVSSTFKNKVWFYLQGVQGSGKSVAMMIV